MRAFWMAIALALLASEAAIAAPAIIGKTNMTSDPGHGTQVEYLQAGGGAFLWYPGNKVVLPGQTCVPVDYQQAFSLLEGAGDTADMTSLWADLKRKAASGNAKARAALSQIGWGH